jgi:hemolysin activation/secretion protein
MRLFIEDCRSGSWVRRVMAWVALIGGLAGAAQAQESGRPAFGEIEQREAQQQKEREDALNRLNVPRPDVRLQPDAASRPEQPWPQESPCFQIQQLELLGDPGLDFQWLKQQYNTGANAIRGACLGPMGVNQVRTRMQNALIDRGWITTRLLVPDQDLSRGVLTLQLVPGRLRSIRMSDGSDVPAMVRTALPTQPGQLLNLRAIEQALENLKRAPSQDADIQIEPSSAEGSQAGDSNLVVSLQRRRPLRLSAFADDSGSEATGKLQGSTTVSYDAPLRLNDLLYVSLNHSLGDVPGESGGTQGHSLHYSVPYQWWLMTLTHNENKYHQSVAQGAIYSGESAQSEAQAERMVYRDARTKVSVNMGVWRKSARNFLNDTEIQLQRRRTLGWLLGVDAQTHWGATQISAEAGLRRGTGAGGALAAPEETTGNGTSRFTVLNVQLSLTRPFEACGTPLQFRSLWRAQLHGTRLAAPERFSIGSRYTVRGFDGNQSLIGDSGFLTRNEWSVPVAALAGQAYWGLDAGIVAGPSSRTAPPGRTLVGTAIGLRGALLGTFGYDIFAGHPLHQPSHLPPKGMNGGFNLNVSY